MAGLEGDEVRKQRGPAVAEGLVRRKPGINSFWWVPALG